jgi:hypothetical protein
MRRGLEAAATRTRHSRKSDEDEVNDEATSQLAQTLSRLHGKSHADDATVAKARELIEAYAHAKRTSSHFSGPFASTVVGPSSDGRSSDIMMHLILNGLYAPTAPGASIVYRPSQTSKRASESAKKPAVEIAKEIVESMAHSRPRSVVRSK